MDRAKRLFVELGVVILGVMIALAADSWREEYLENQIESEYLGRLKADLTAGIAVLETERDTYRKVREAALQLITPAEAPGQLEDQEEVLDLLITAAAMGFDRQEMASDATFQELVASGQLSLLSDHAVREGVVSYYQQADRLAESLEELPQLNVLVGSLTGHFPVDILRYGAELSSEDRARLLFGLLEDPQILLDIRMLHAHTLFNDRDFEDLTEQARRLLLLLEREAPMERG